VFGGPSPFQHNRCRVDRGLSCENSASLGAATGSILAAGASFAQIPAEHVQAGTLTCDISGGIGFIIGPQKAFNCSFVSSFPGAPEFYSGVINKLGVDLGGTGGGVMIWAVYAPTTRAAGFHRRDLCRRFRRGHGGRRYRRHMLVGAFVLYRGRDAFEPAGGALHPAHHGHPGRREKLTLASNNRHTRICTIKRRPGLRVPFYELQST
jgi:hypothetical protein